MVTLNDASWFGLMLGQDNMAYGGDIVAFFGIDERSYFADYMSEGYQPPALDIVQSVTEHPQNTIEFEDDGRVTLFARRLRDTDSMEDFMIPLDQEFTIGYAFNSYSDTMSWYTKHETAGAVQVVLPSDGTPIWGEMMQAVPVDNVSPTDAIIDSIFNFINDGSSLGLVSGSVAVAAMASVSLF